jgi:hypothetical protein
VEVALERIPVKHDRECAGWKRRALSRVEEMAGKRHRLADPAAQPNM